MDTIWEELFFDLALKAGRSERVKALERQMENYKRQLSFRLNKSDKKLVLRMIDAKGLILEEASLRGFVSGFQAGLRIGLDAGRDAGTVSAIAFSPENQRQGT